MAHIRYRAGHASQQENPWSSVLESLKEKRKEAPVPRKLSDWQAYMRDVDGAAKIKAVFEERWVEANRPEREKLAFRGEIARELLAGEADDVRARMQQESKKLHEKDLLTYDADEAVEHEAPDEDSKSWYVFFIHYRLNDDAYPYF